MNNDGPAADAVRAGWVKADGPVKDDHVGLAAERWKRRKDLRYLLLGTSSRKI